MKSSRLCAVLVVLAFALFTTSCSSKFSEAQILGAENDIRAQYQKQGFTVEQVNLVKESDRRLSGFVRFRKSSGLLSKVQITKNCTATMDADSSRYIWECK
jgi:hypothetical protein